MDSHARDDVIAMVASWPGVIVDDSTPGIVAFHLGFREMGHLHGRNVGHVPVPPGIRNEIIAAGSATPHPMFPNANWVEIVVKSPADAEQLLRLLRLNYDRFEQRLTA
jgi:hypothetical protein